ncbi:hypothetical protein I601_1028 [Nocardioides dokdonensis FR1436]|uniref:Uncharacterized protein n=1 Tax=Nocardioides dokdonensis FR1436 TaxID=1300347 RepID=A0A1A9GIG1_9ACTN|nr:hypothetical protein I601_1028 [Nocardioides dokdonensis FR1436]
MPPGATAPARYRGRVSVRGLGSAAALLVVLALAGGAAGYAVARADHDRPARTDDVRPLAAAGPAYPTDRPVLVRDDREEPALEADLPLRRVVLGTPPFTVSLSVPRGWVRSDSAGGEWRWYPPPSPDDAENLYFLRVRQVANLFQSVPSARAARVGALATASEVQDLEIVEERYDSLEVSYVAGGYRRHSLERWLTTPGSGETAQFYLGMVGREVDSKAMTRLITRIADSARIG